MWSFKVIYTGVCLFLRQKLKKLDWGPHHEMSVSKEFWGTRTTSQKAIGQAVAIPALLAYFMCAVGRGGAGFAAVLIAATHATVLLVVRSSTAYRAGCCWGGCYMHALLPLPYPELVRHRIHGSRCTVTTGFASCAYAIWPPVHGEAKMHASHCPCALSSSVHTAPREIRDACVHALCRKESRTSVTNNIQVTSTVNIVYSSSIGKGRVLTPARQHHATGRCCACAP